MIMPEELIESMKGCIISEDDEMKQVVGVIRDLAPAHYSAKIESWSLLSNKLQFYESTIFKAGGCDWVLLFYPNGDKGKNVNDHISVYLRIHNTESFCPGWELNVFFKFFLYDQTRDKYLALGDIGGRTMRFHQMKTQQGFSTLFPLTTFNDASNGYLIDDACVFGAEVFVYDYTEQAQEHLSMINGAVSYKHTWTIEKFSQITGGLIVSKVFFAGGHRWQIKLYPKGNSDRKGTSVSIYLYMVDANSLTVDEQVLVEFKLCIRSQTHEEHIEHNDLKWFSSDESFKGVHHFMEVEALYDPSKGFFRKNKCIVEAEVSVLGVYNRLV